MSEQQEQEQRDATPEDLEPRDQADEIRGGTTATTSNVQKQLEDARKTAANNLRG